MIDLFVKVGDAIKVDDAIVTLESGQGHHGRAVHRGRHGQGSAGSARFQGQRGAVLIRVEAGSCRPVARVAAAPPRRRLRQRPGSGASSHAGGADLGTRNARLGAGPGGYSAAFRSADLGMKTIIVERYATLGGIASTSAVSRQALLHVAAVMEEAEHASAWASPSPAAGRYRQAARPKRRSSAS